MPNTSTESIAAYDSVQPTKAETCCRILAYGKWCGLRGFTADEVAAEWSCSPNHCAPRITELYKAGHLILTDMRRRTRSGCWARVYVVKRKPDPQVESRATLPVARPSTPAYPLRTRNHAPTGEEAELLFSMPSPPWRDDG